MHTAGRAPRVRLKEKAMAEALEHRSPVLVDLVTDPNALSMPPHITAAEVKGVALAASKMVLGASDRSWRLREPTCPTFRALAS